MASLSPRERQILTLVAAGRTSKEIAADLRISVSTVNWHLSNAFGKLGASSRAEAVALALGAREVDQVSAPLLVRRRPTWHGAVAALALVVLGGTIVAGIDSVPVIPAAAPPRPAATGVPADARPSPFGERTASPATVTATPPAPIASTSPAGQPGASGPPPSAAPIPPLSVPGALPLPPASPLPASLPLPTASPLPLPTVAPLPLPLPLPTVTPLPLPTVTPLPLPAVTPVPLPTASPVPLPAPTLLPPLPLPTLGLP